MCAATVDVVEGNGAEVTWTVKTAIRYCTVDEHEPGLNNPVPIPESGYNYSYWKSLALSLTASFTKIDNIRLYSDGTIDWNFGSGGQLGLGVKDSGDHGCPDGSYQAATGTQGTSGHRIEDSHPYYSGETTKVCDIDSFVSASPATIDSDSYTAAGRTKHAVLQAKLDTAANGAAQGSQSAETLVWKYDEI